MKRVVFVFFLLLSVASVAICLAEEEASMPLSSVDYLTGFGYHKLRDDLGNYNVFPLFVDFNFNLNPWLARHNIRPSGLAQMGLEPFIGYVSSPNNNAEIGLNFFIKYGFFPEDRKLQPYVKASIGGMYMTQHVPFQSTQLNFNEYAGLGAHYYFKKGTALTAEYRFRHLSNGGVKDPNSGLNTHFVLVGITQSL